MASEAKEVWDVSVAGWETAIREFAIVFQFALPKLGRTEDKNNTIFTDFSLAFSKYGPYGDMERHPSLVFRRGPHGLLSLTPAGV